LKQALYPRADYYALVGDRARAIGCLKRHFEFYEPDISIPNDPDLRSLHDDPEFEAIVADIRKRLEL